MAMYDKHNASANLMVGVESSHDEDCCTERLCRMRTALSLEQTIDHLYLQLRFAMQLDPNEHLHEKVACLEAVRPCVTWRCISVDEHVHYRNPELHPNRRQRVLLKMAQMPTSN